MTNNPSGNFSDHIDNRFDIVLPFHLARTGIRGRLVRLKDSAQKIIEQHNYPEIVNIYMGQAIALSQAIMNCFKFEGRFILQISGDGPIKLIVVDTNSQGDIRACARFDDELLSQVHQDNLKKLHYVFGKATMVMTLDPESSQEQYQGIVELVGSSLAESANHFFKQSEQLETGIVVVSDVDSDKLPCATIMIQRLPLQDDFSIEEKELLDDSWIHALSLVGSTTKKELLDPQLLNSDLLYRLFWEEGVRVYEGKPCQAKCRCSETRIREMLATFSSEDIQDMIEEQMISVTCEFCGETYTFDETEF